MTALAPEQLQAEILDALLDVAPDIDASTLDPRLPFRAQFDFDSMDHLNFVVGLHRKLGIDVPEADYPELATLDGCVRYVSRALGVSRE